LEAGLFASFAPQRSHRQVPERRRLSNDAARTIGAPEMMSGTRLRAPHLPGLARVADSIALVAAATTRDPLNP